MRGGVVGCATLSRSSDEFRSPVTHLGARPGVGRAPSVEPSRAPGAGSVAIDKGHSSGATADQRGLARPRDLAAVANAAGGDGSDSGAVEAQGMCVTGVPAPPVAGDDNANVLEDSGANVLSVLANDTEANGDALAIVSVTQGANGSVANNGNSVSYTPNADFFGADSFTYTVSDGNGARTPRPSTSRSRTSTTRRWRTTTTTR